jgi:propionate CoA-transferase
MTNVEGFYDFICGKYVPSGNILKACREEIRPVISSTSKRGSLHTAIAKRAVREIQKGMIVNIGIGIPELVAEEVLQKNMLEDVHLSVESGHTGGFPLGGQGFGVAIGPDSMLDMARQFDFYEGGGLDLGFIGALEVDKHGNVNGHYTKGKLSGIGGFANITQTTKKVVFCFTFTSKGLEGEFDGESVHITKEGSIRKFVDSVAGLSFSVQNAYENEQEIMYITERCVFVLTHDGLMLTEVAPGVDMQKDILDKIPFPIKVADNVQVMRFD